MQKNGFTLIEIVMIVGIIGVLAAITVAGLISLRNNTDIDGATAQVISALELARSRAEASLNEESYGVHFEADSYTIFVGTTYDSAAASNETTNLNNKLEFANISLNGGGSDIVFDKLTATTSQSGTLDLRKITDTSNSRTIKVLASGFIGTGGTITPTGSAITDSRHTHFDLGWSMQSSTTLTLTFVNSPNPNTTENITIASFMNGDLSEFDWEGEVDVDGDTQTMRIHTHLLDASDTELSITRDGRFNDKEVTVEIDGNEIVNYAQDGTATVGAFGGTMEAQ